MDTTRKKRTETDIDSGINMSERKDRNEWLKRRYQELVALEDGWLNGEGLALHKDGLKIVFDRLIADYPQECPTPFIYPTPEGNLFVEWEAQGCPSLDINLVTFDAYFHALEEDGGCVDQNISISEDGWDVIFSFLEANIEAG